MINQRLSRSLQSLARQQTQCTRLQQRSISSSPFASRAFAPAAASRLPARRWYSEAQAEQTAKQEEKGEQAKSEKVQEEAMKTDPAQKELEAKNKEKGEQAKSEKVQEEAMKTDPAQKELEAKNKEVLDLTDRLKRSIADYRNLQEQTKREVTAAREFALQRFAKDLLDSVDNLDRALETVPKEKLTDANPDLQNLHSGLKMTETILMQTLKKNGLERFDPSEKGDKFDPNRHEAMFQAPMQGKEDGTVFHTQQKGFTYNGRVLRAAKVGVAKNS